MKRWLPVLECAIIGVGLGHASAASKLGPAQLVDALHTHPESVFHFIVRGKSTGLEAAQKLAQDDNLTPAELPIINGLYLELKESDAESLAARADIFQIYYLRAELANTYFHILQALDYARSKVPKPGVVNVSLGPEPAIMPIESQADEPMNVATREVSDEGLVVVMAVGNYFTPDSPNPGVINPWCRVAWVICVGAASEDASALYKYSARGTANDPMSWPDVVADGIDVMSTWPRTLAKSPLQIQHDHSSAQWRALSPEEQLGWAVMSGTSQATAQVSRAAAQIIYFFRNAILSTKNATRDTPIFSIEFPRDRFDSVSRRGQRITGDVTHPSKDVVEVTYRADDPWKVVKQVLMDTAIPMPQYLPKDVGAGFVSPDYIDAQFGRFEVGQPTIMPLKVIP